MQHLLLEFIGRSTLIAASAAAIVFLFRVRGAAGRHTLWTGVLLSMLLLPFWIAQGPKAALRVLPPRPAGSLASLTSPTPPVQRSTTLPAARVPPAPQPPVWTWTAAALAIYILGASILLLRLAIGTIRATRVTPASCAAPVTVGVLRPRIVLPEAETSWTAAQFDAVLTHERAHVRRRDPLIQWLALLNRALFWFHPLSWWIERRLTALAEEACDDAVLRRGVDAADYSACLLELARAVHRAGARVEVHRLAMPGSDLPRRIRRIAAGLPVPGTSVPTISVAVGALAVCTGVFAAATLDQAAPPWPIPAVRPKFEVVSIRPCKPSDITPGQGKKGGRGGGGRVRTSPGSIVAECRTVEELIRMAYLDYADGKPWTPVPGIGIPEPAVSRRVRSQELKAPAWVGNDRYTVEAKGAGAAAEPMMRGPMMQMLLEDRFRLKLRVEMRDAPVYLLTVASGGPKLEPSMPGSCISLLEFEDKYPGPRRPGEQRPRVCGPFHPSILDRNPNVDRAVAERSIGLDTYGQTMAALTLQFSVSTDRDVIDRTGLTGQYDIHLDVASQDLFPPPPATGDDAEPPPTAAEKVAHIAAAVQKLGLKLESGKAPAPFLVIDHVERPSPN